MEWSLRTGIVLTPDRRSHAAIARIEPITRATRSAPVDPARSTDLHERSQVLPDARLVPPADVLKFQEYLFGPGAEGLSSGSPARMTHPVAVGSAGPGALQGPDAVLTPAAAPADRIAATLAHLRHLRGL